MSNPYINRRLWSDKANCWVTLFGEEKPYYTRQYTENDTTGVILSSSRHDSQTDFENILPVYDPAIRHWVTISTEHGLNVEVLDSNDGPKSNDYNPCALTLHELSQIPPAVSDLNLPNAFRMKQIVAVWAGGKLKNLDPNFEHNLRDLYQDPGNLSSQIAARFNKLTSRHAGYLDIALENADPRAVAKMGEYTSNDDIYAYFHSEKLPIAWKEGHSWTYQMKGQEHRFILSPMTLDNLNDSQTYHGVLFRYLSDMSLAEKSPANSVKIAVPIGFVSPRDHWASAVFSFEQLDVQKAQELNIIFARYREMNVTQDHLAEMLLSPEDARNQDHAQSYRTSWSTIKEDGARVKQLLSELYQQAKGEFYDSRHTTSLTADASKAFNTAFKDGSFTQDKTLRYSGKQTTNDCGIYTASTIKHVIETGQPRDFDQIKDQKDFVKQQRAYQSKKILGQTVSEPKFKTKSTPVEDPIVKEKTKPRYTPPVKPKPTVTTDDSDRQRADSAPDEIPPRDKKKTEVPPLHRRPGSAPADYTRPQADKHRNTASASLPSEEGRATLATKPAFMDDQQSTFLSAVTGKRFTQEVKDHKRVYQSDSLVVTRNKVELNDIADKGGQPEAQEAFVRAYLGQCLRQLDPELLHDMIGKSDWDSQDMATLIDRLRDGEALPELRQAIGTYRLEIVEPKDQNMLPAFNKNIQAIQAMFSQYGLQQDQPVQQPGSAPMAKTQEPTLNESAEENGSKFQP